MNFTVDKFSFTQKLALLAGTVERKTTIPVLSMVYVEADGDKVTLRTTNLDTGLTVTLPAKVTTPGKAVVPLKKVKDYLSLLSECQINVSVSDKFAFTFSVVGKKIKNRIAGLSAESFPELPAPPEVKAFSVSASKMALALNRSSYCISKDSSRFSVDGLLLHSSGGKAKFVATDGNRLAIAELDIELDEGFRALIPTALANLLGKVFTEETVDVSLDDNHIFVKGGDTVLMSRRLSGNFPDYERIVPKNTTGFTVPRERLLEVCRRASTANIQETTTMALQADITAEGIDFSISNGNVLIEETLEFTDCTIGPIKFGINAAYVIEYLTRSNGENTRIDLKDGTGALVFSPVDGDEVAHLCVIMPMRV